MRLVSGITIILFMMIVISNCAITSRSKKTLDAAVFDDISPRSDEVVVVGYSPATYDTTRSTILAIENGLMRLALYLGIELTDSTLYAQRSRFRESFRSNTTETLINVEGILDISASVRILGIAHNTQGIKSVALGVSHPSFSGIKGGKFPSILMVKRPEWIDTLPEENGYYFAVGMSEPWYDPLGGMRAAEVNARKSLAQTIKVQILSNDVFFESLRGVSINRYALITTNEILTHTELYDLWEDPVTGMTHALVRAPFGTIN